MRAILYTGSGGSEVISVTEVDNPSPASGHVRVRVKAAGLNRADIIQRKGAYPAPAGWPANIPGLEYAGVVESLGSGVGSVRVGDRVMGLVGGGAHAEFVVPHEREVIPVPAGLTDEQAAAIPEAFLTAYDALAVRGRAARGERVLIHAVGSGVSTAAVQIAKWLGCTVVGTSRTASKLDRALALGMDDGVNTSETGFREAVGEPVHVILDYFGGPALADNLAVLATKGRLVLLVTLQGGVAPTGDVGRILRGRLEVIGTVMRARPHEERVPLVQEFIRRVLPELVAGRMVPVIGGSFPMESMAAAQAAMESNQLFGKIVLTW